MSHLLLWGRGARVPRPLWLALALLALAGARVAVAQDAAKVELRGVSIFTVGATETQTAAARARAIQDRLKARLDGDAPLAPVRVVAAGDSAWLLLDQDTVAVARARDAELAEARPVAPGESARAARRLAESWATALREAFARIAAAERSRVVVQGVPLFDVGGTPELRAARRATAIGVRVGELAATPGEAPVVRAERRGNGAVVLAGSDVLVTVTPADAATRGTTSLELAREWAAAITRAIDDLREQGTGRYALRIAVIAVVVVLAALAIHLLLRLLARRFAAQRQRTTGETWGLRPLIAGWAVRLVQFLLWLGVVLFVLWLVPRTRPVAFGAGARSFTMATRALEWLTGDGIVVALIVGITILAARFIGAVVQQLIEVIGVRQGGRAALRASTLTGSATRGAQGIILFFGLLTLLAQVGVELVPLLAGAGVVGIALGFGVQTLIRDFFTGFFILIEDQYGVGDIVRVQDATGTVERFTLRITQLRSIDGSLTSIPNGEIKLVTNLSKDWSQAVLDVHILLGEDVDRATTVIAATAKQLADEWRERIRGEPQVLGVEAIDPASRTVALRVVVRTAPMERWTVTRELRRRILDAFEQAGIEVPPRTVVTLPPGTK
jgi:small conductance mechanosensitive channel